MAEHIVYDLRSLISTSVGATLFWSFSSMQGTTNLMVREALYTTFSPSFRAGLPSLFLRTNCGTSTSVGS
jgi:hypothetical protein